MDVETPTTDTPTDTPTPTESGGLSNLLSGEINTEIPSDSNTDVDTPTQENEDGVSPPQEGDRPEWLPEKFKDATAMAEAYKNLESKFGNFTGAPETYEITKPEGVDFEFYENSEFGVNQFQDMAKEMGLDQSGFNKVMEFYINSESQRAGMEMKAREDSVYEVFGGQEKATKEIPQISARVKGSIGEEGMKVYQDAASGSPTAAASAIKLAGMLINKFDGEYTPTKHAPQDSSMSKKELAGALLTPEYAKDPEYKARIDAEYKRAYNL